MPKYEVLINKTITKLVIVETETAEKALEAARHLYANNIVSFDGADIKSSYTIELGNDVYKDSVQEQFLEIDWEQIQENDYVYYRKKDYFYKVVKYPVGDTEMLLMINLEHNDIKPMQEFYENEFYELTFYRKIK
jgi:hypothetical protein